MPSELTIVKGKENSTAPYRRGKKEVVKSSFIISFLYILFLTLFYNSDFFLILVINGEEDVNLGAYN